MSELKPCPFCGSHNVKMFYDERQNYHVECYGCNKTVSFHIVKESSWRKAVATWNRRAQPASDPLTLEQLAESQRRERAAVEDMKIIVETASECNVCKHRVGVSGCPIRYKECRFEWRGPQNKKGEAE